MLLELFYNFLKKQQLIRKIFILIILLEWDNPLHSLKVNKEEARKFPIKRRGEDSNLRPPGFCTSFNSPALCQLSYRGIFLILLSHFYFFLAQRK